MTSRTKFLTCHSSLGTRHCLFNLRVDRLRCARAVNVVETASMRVIVEQRLRLTFVSFKPARDRLRVIIGTPPEPRLRVQVAHLVHFRRSEIDVVNLAADGTVAPARRALLQDVEWHIHQYGYNCVP